MRVLSQRVVSVGPAAREPLARTLSSHLPEYASEALGLAVFMLSACAFALLLEHPGSPVRQAIPGAFARRALMGLAMCATLLVNVHAPWGRRSGAHLNPAFTLAFWQLGRMRAADLAGYALAQFAGGVLGVFVACALAGHALADPHVRFVVTQPGPAGEFAAFAGELAIAFVQLSVVLRVLAVPRLAPRTAWFAAALLAADIAFESPLSDTSMNPARTFGSAFVAHDWRAFGIYLVAPVLAMTLAALAYRAELAWRGTRSQACAKLLHTVNERCFFCGQRASERTGTSSGRAAFTTGRRSA